MNTDILAASLFTPGLGGRWGLPRLYWGPPGPGKTSRGTATVHSLGLICLVILSSIRDPSDFNGIPVPREVPTFGPDGKQDGTRIVMTMAPPDWAVEAARHKFVVIYFDEISTASPSVQAALLRVILEGVVGDFRLPPEVRFIAAANPANMASGGFELTTPMANRFGHENTNLNPDGTVNFDMNDLSGWCDWLITSGTTESAKADINPALLQDRVMARWADEYAKARGEVVGFMHSAAGDRAC